MKPTKCPAREKYLEILLFAHARTSQAKTEYFASGSEGREVYDL